MACRRIDASRHPIEFSHLVHFFVVGTLPNCIKSVKVRMLHNKRATRTAGNMQMESQVASAELVVGYGRVAAQLRQDILDGSIASGSWLRLHAVAKRCGVSVQPVREALQQLCGEGLIEILP